jgi:hypothetical protein
MNKITAFCGLVCTECQAYIATKEDNDQKRRDTAKAWSTPDYRLKPADINCDGCTTKNGRVISFVEACTIRKCGMGKGILNCAHCPTYACDQLQKSHQRSPEAKQTLDTIHQELNKQ